MSIFTRLSSKEAARGLQSIDARDIRFGFGHALRLGRFGEGMIRTPLNQKTVEGQKEEAHLPYFPASFSFCLPFGKAERGGLW